MKFINVVLVSLFLILPCQALAAENIRKITVTGKSETVVEAQYAIIKLSIKYVRKEMNQSHAELMKTISKLNNDLQSIGLSDKDIKKSLILQGPEYSMVKDTEVLKGYYTQCQIDLYVNDMGKIGGVYKKLANYKSVTIEDTDYKRRDIFDVRKTEYEKALQAARKKAEYMTQALNVKIGKVHTIQEFSFEDLSEINYADKRKRVAAIIDPKKGYLSESGEANTGYGNIKITATVLVEFELE